MAAYASITSSVTKFALTGLMLVALATGAEARGWFGTGKPAQESIALSELPVQGQRTYEAILNGGPFRFEKDGTVFGNRERLCRPRGAVTTASTRWQRPARAIAVHGALSAAENSAPHPRPAGTRQTTTRVSDGLHHER